LTAARCITVHIAADGMAAWVDVLAGPPADAEQLADAVRRAGVTHGVEAAVCAGLAEALVDEQLVVRELGIAVGQPARPGSDGYFSPAFEPGIRAGRIDGDGSMDFRDRGLLKPVRPGDRLGHLYPAIEGRAGKRVDGGDLAVLPVRQASLTLGSGVSQRADGEVVADAAGVILYVPQKSLAVVQQHSHRGDVDLKSGHLDMAGSLTISGDVLRLFCAAATGDVDIGGMVAGGSVHAGGSIHVRGAVQGGEQGSLYAGGDVAVKTADRAQIVCHGLLTLESAVNCLLEAEVIQVGIVRGGEARAERFVTVMEAGAASGTETLIAVAVPLEPVRDEVREAVASAKQQRTAQRARGGGGGLERARGGKMGRALAGLQRDELTRAVLVRTRQAELLETAHVVVQGVAHPGLTVRVGTAQLSLQGLLAPTRFSFDAQTRSIRCERYVQ